mgnify:FL=1
MGLTILKRVCRKLGIPRWPYNRVPKAQQVRTCVRASAQLGSCISLTHLLKSLCRVAAVGIVPDTAECKRACIC